MKQSWFDRLFCIREPDIGKDNLQRAITSTMKQEMKLNWLSKSPSLEVDLNPDLEVARKEELLLQRQLTYIDQMNFSDELKASQMIQLMYKCGGLLVRATEHSIEITYSEWLTSLYKGIHSYERCLVPIGVCEQISRRARSDRVLISHDSVGSLIFHLGSAAREINYLEQNPKFSTIVEKGIEIRKLNARKVIKMDLIEKVDVVVINLLDQTEIFLKSIMWEYLSFGHDLIVILPAKLDNTVIYHQADAAIKQSTQSRQHCSIEVQTILDNKNHPFAKILYFGEVSEITLNEELNYLYACISPNVKKSHNYKLLLKEVRNHIGMSAIVQLFYDSQLLFDGELESFHRFISLVKIVMPELQFSRYVHQHSIDHGTESASSTESDEEEPKQKNVKSKSVEFFRNDPIIQRQTRSQ